MAPPHWHFSSSDPVLKRLLTTSASSNCPKRFKKRKKDDVPIIMLTAKDQVSDKVLGLESGADDYLVKPFDYLELAARIKACLRRRKTTASDRWEIRAGDVLLNRKDRTVIVRGKRVELTKKEFEILWLLVENAGMVLERERIKKELWPKEKLYKWSRTIDVYIQHIRSKSGDKLDSPHYIKTIPGVGYMFCK